MFNALVLMLFISLITISCDSYERQIKSVPTKGEPIQIGRRLQIHSNVLNENRAIRLYLPESYSTSTFSYPVLYLLDGATDFLHTVGIVEFLSWTDRIPELIVVGIENTNRSRDLTPPSENRDETDFWDQTGGADRFRRFLQEELLPYIDENYRTEKYRIIRGQSFGGLLAIHDYMSRDAVFNAYLTSSASVGWNYGAYISRAEAFFKDSARAPLYISAAGRDNSILKKDIKNFTDIIVQQVNDKLRWKYEMFADDEHYSLVLMSTHNALRFLFAGWQVPDSVAASADFEEYSLHYRRLSNVLGYEINIPLRAVIRLGNNLLRKKQYEQGIEILKKNLGLYPQQPESYWHVADAYILSGRPEQARSFFISALEKAEMMNRPDVEDFRRSLDIYK